MAGVRYAFSPTWSTSTSALVEHRFADWTVEEVQTNQTRTIDDYTITGLYAGMNYRF